MAHAPDTIRRIVNSLRSLPIVAKAPIRHARQVTVTR